MTIILAKDLLDALNITVTFAAPLTVIDGGFSRAHFLCNTAILTTNFPCNKYALKWKIFRYKNAQLQIYY